MTTFDKDLCDGVPVFRPTVEEFANFARFVESIESQCTAGLAKIIPPPTWRARENYENLEDYVVKKPIKQEFHGRGGIFYQVNVSAKSKTIRKFRDLANSDTHRPPGQDERRTGRRLKQSNTVTDENTKSEMSDWDSRLAHLEKIEYLYWRSIHVAQPYYGADMAGSLFDESVTEWNLNDLHSELDRLPAKLPGVNVPYLYFGMWRATFSWHVEDMDLFSINYLHFGAAKQWYCVSPKYRVQFETLAKSMFEKDSRECSEFLRHKTFLFSPAMLESADIPYHRAIQESGQFMITFPGAYHSGFNHGFNCAESVNFALPSWIPIGKKAKTCKCVEDSVKIDMRVFDSNYNSNSMIAEHVTIKHEDAGTTENPVVRSPRRRVPKKSYEEYTTDDVIVDDEPKAYDVSAEIDPDNRKEKIERSPKLKMPRLQTITHFSKKIAMETPIAADVVEWPSPRDRCHVCFESGTTLLSCHTCDLVIHPNCYGFVVGPHAHPFECDTCLSRSFEAQCCLCPVIGGPLKATERFQWCHVACANYIPETNFATDGINELIVGLANIPKQRFSLKCFVCNQTHSGACMQCWEGECKQAMHPGCLFVQQFNTETQLIPFNRPPFALRPYCRRHDKTLRARELAPYKARLDQPIWLLSAGGVEALLTRVYEDGRKACLLLFADGKWVLVKPSEVALQKPPLMDITSLLTVSS